MLNRTGMLAVALLALGACSSGNDQGEPAEPQMPMVQALPNIPLPPGGVPLNTEQGSDAAQLLVSTPMMADSVAEFYRDLLGRPPYRLINEATEKSVTSFYVEQDGPALWVTVQGLEAGGTIVRLAGAAIRDTVVAPTDSTGDS